MALEQYNRFNRYHQDWSSKNTSDTELIDNLWLKTHRFNNTNNNNNEEEHFLTQSTLSNNDNDLNQPPYHHYQQYHIVDTEK